jgi:hypothetical protein
MSWGVTVVTAVMKEMAVKTPRLDVMQRPSLGESVVLFQSLRYFDLPHRCCEEDQAAYEWTSGQQIPEGT